jgi:hypothetical protein
MNNIVAAAIAVVSAVILLGSGAWPFPNLGSTYSGTPESITIGNLPLLYSTSYISLKIRVILPGMVSM